MTRVQERQYIFDKYNGKCAYCGCSLTKGWHVDHIEPIRRDYNTGSNTCMNPELDILENKNPSCPSCNINKHSMSLEDYRFTINGYVNSMNLRMTQYKMAKKYGLVKETGIEVIFYFEKLKK